MLGFSCVRKDDVIKDFNDYAIANAINHQHIMTVGGLIKAGLAEDVAEVADFNKYEGREVEVYNLYDISAYNGRIIDYYCTSKLKASCIPNSYIGVDKDFLEKAYDWVLTELKYHQLSEYKVTGYYDGASAGNCNGLLATDNGGSVVRIPTGSTVYYSQDGYLDTGLIKVLTSFKEGVEYMLGLCDKYIIWYYNV